MNNFQQVIHRINSNNQVSLTINDFILRNENLVDEILYKLTGDKQYLAESIITGKESNVSKAPDSLFEEVENSLATSTTIFNITGNNVDNLTKKLTLLKSFFEDQVEQGPSDKTTGNVTTTDHIGELKVKYGG